MSLPEGRPAPDEYAPFYAGYVGRVPDGPILENLGRQLEATCALLAPLSRERALARPKPDDWNILEVLGHITDAEQVFAYRALRIARGDQTPLAGFDQDDYVRAAHFAERELAELIEAYAAQRRATIAMLRSFNEGDWLRRGNVSGNPCSARAWVYVVAGHELYHIDDFHERYGI